MNRRHYLIAYDIADDKTRTRVYQALRDEGDHIQYSVFLCDLDPRELAELVAYLEPLINHATDQILFLDAGPDTRPIYPLLRILGRPFSPPSRVRIV